MIEPGGVINCQRAGPSTGVPHEDRQGDLWQMLGAAFGDYPRVSQLRGHRLLLQLIPEIFNLADRFQVPRSGALRSLAFRGRLSVSIRKDLVSARHRPWGIISTDGSSARGHERRNKRYKITDSGISPRAVPGVPGHIHTVATDEHMEDGVLNQDEFTNPIKRRHDGKGCARVAGIEAACRRPAVGSFATRCYLNRLGFDERCNRGGCEILNDEESRRISADPLACAVAWRCDFSKF